MLLLSLLLVILLHPMLDHGDLRRFILTALTFVPVILATIRLSQMKRLVWPSALMMAVTLISGSVAALIPNQVLLIVKWGSLAAFFALTVAGLFTYLRRARSIAQSHLYTAVSVYLLLGMLWFALYSLIDTAYPGSFQHGSVPADRQSELLYFSLVTLATVGYGDIVPLHGEARMLAALEGVVGVLYVAITVAILVSAFRRQDTQG